MADVLSRRRWGSRWSWAGFLGGLAGLSLLIGPAPAQQPPASKSQPPAGKTAKGQPAAAAGKEPAKDEGNVIELPPADPSQSRRGAPVEVFKDPNAEAMLDVKSLKAVQALQPTQNDIARVEEMAGNVNLPIDRVLIDRVVRGLAARLTDPESIKSLLEGPSEDAPRDAAGKKPAAARPKRGDGGKGIQDAATRLLRPIFVARGAKNDPFLRDYSRSLYQYLVPLLQNHLVPRVQAMIVLGEAAVPTQEYLQLFQREISKQSQALWVKLWAIEGIHNIKKYGGRFAVDMESKAGQTISKFLEDDKELPWPVQMRGLEALGSLRQSGLPAEAARAEMANTAMLFLSDTDAKLEVRSEAARALGLMQVNAVPRYNFKLVAYYAGRLAADAASELNDQYSDSPPRAENPTRADYLAVLLVGPIYQCFNGVPGESNSGILQTGRADADSMKYIQGVFQLLQPMAQAAIDLRGAPTKDYKARKQALASRVAAMRDFLKQNPPPSWRLVERGREYGGGGGQAGVRPPAAAEGPAVAGLRRGR